MQFLLLVTEPRAGRANGTRTRWEDVDDGSDGGCSATARPHGKQNTGRANEDERNLKLCLTLVEFAKWRAVAGCYSSASAHLLIAAIHSHRVLSWQALAFGVFSRARCGEETPPFHLVRLVAASPPRISIATPQTPLRRCSSIAVWLSASLRRRYATLQPPRGMQATLNGSSA